MSESEEMYLVTLARLKEAGVDGPVPLSQLAAELDVLPVSANQMIRKLEQADLVEYTPYRGADLTLEGARRAFQVLRHRRLWEVFLVDHLKINPEAADEAACRMEHAVPDQAAERLAEFLGKPAVTPSGKPIPDAQAAEQPVRDRSLSSVKVDETALVSRVLADRQARSFLQMEGIVPGVEVKVLAIGNKGAMLLSTCDEGCIQVAGVLADIIFVR